MPMVQVRSVRGLVLNGRVRMAMSVRLVGRFVVIVCVLVMLVMSERTTITIGAGERVPVTLRCAFRPEKLVVDPDVRVLMLERFVALRVAVSSPQQRNHPRRYFLSLRAPGSQRIGPTHARAACRYCCRVDAVDDELDTARDALPTREDGRVQRGLGKADLPS